MLIRMTQTEKDIILQALNTLKEEKRNFINNNGRFASTQIQELVRLAHQDIQIIQIAATNLLTEREQDDKVAARKILGESPL